ncbi:MAG: YicC/YloC family endoribonuclease [Pseudomonadota bacterium]
MVHSMTGFASESGASNDAAGSLSWTVELRGVNAKGLDIRVRAPERMAGFDQAVKTRLQKALSRGNVTVSVRYEAQGADSALRINEDVLSSVMGAAKTVQAKAENAGVALSAPTVADFLALRGVIIAGEEAELVPSAEAVMETVARALDAFVAMRAAEGQALKALLNGNLVEVAGLVTQAAELAEARKDKAAETLRLSLTRILENADGADADRVAQELALLAVKADVTEEIDRLHAHVEAARTLLETGGAVGRKLDFLMQEFNREANTLCAKSGSTDLTRVGLDLKALIDQMREQVQNVE